MGVTYKGGNPSRHTLRENSSLVKVNPFYKYDPGTGYFGETKKGLKPGVRLVYTNGDPKNDAKVLFDQLTNGSEIAEEEKGKFWDAKLEDGSTITLRIDHPTPDHAPAVMISVKNSKDSADIKTQKIHFVKKGESK